MTTEELLKIFKYDPETGTIVLLNNPDKSLGWKSNGYIKITLKTNKYYAHRLAWELYYNKKPEHQVDHINGIRDDNRICNLRNADFFKNGQNRGKIANNTSGYKGVFKNNKTGYWTSQIGYNGKYKYLGFFYTKEEAYAAYCKAAKELHGEFVNLG